MRYLRMLTNSILGGLLGAVYVTILTLQLNPALPLRSDVLGPLFATFALFYATHLSALFYGLIVARQMFAEEILSPGWISVRLLAWLSAGTCAMASLLTWLNLRGFRVSLDLEAARRMALGAAALAVAATALLMIAAVHYSFGRRGSRVSAALLAVTVLASVGAPLAFRGPARPPVTAAIETGLGELPAAPASPRVRMLLLDGASFDYVSLAVAEGRLPNLGRILDAGAAMHLATLRPTQPEPVWTAVATGKFPPKNGVRSAATYRLRAGTAPLELLPDLCFSYGMVHLGFLTETPHRATVVRAAPFWEVLSRLGLSVTVVGWPLTYPAQPVRGVVVSDRLHLTGSGTVDEHSLVFPPEALSGTRASLDEAVQADAAVAASAEPEAFLGTTVPDAPTPRDRIYREVASELERRLDVQLSAIRYDGLDLIGHTFLRYAMPRPFGDVSAEERQRYGHVLDRHYGFIDAEVGAAMTALGPDDLLLVVSGFGMQPVSLGKRLLARILGDPPFSGSHEGAPDGFLLAYGAAVAPGRLALGSIVDVAPTVLYFLGLPVGRDMDGYARTDLFTRQFTAQRPITFIPSHEGR